MPAVQPYGRLKADDETSSDDDILSTKPKSKRVDQDAEIRRLKKLLARTEKAARRSAQAAKAQAMAKKDAAESGDSGPSSRSGSDVERAKAELSDDSGCAKPSDDNRKRLTERFVTVCLVINMLFVLFCLRWIAQVLSVGPDPASATASSPAPLRESTTSASDDEAWETLAPRYQGGQSREPASAASAGGRAQEAPGPGQRPEKVWDQREAPRPGLRPEDVWDQDWEADTAPTTPAPPTAQRPWTRRRSPAKPAAALRSYPRHDLTPKWTFKGDRDRSRLPGFDGFDPSATRNTSGEAIFITADLNNMNDKMSLHTNLQKLRDECSWARGVQVYVLYDDYAEHSTAVDVLQSLFPEVICIDLVTHGYWTPPSGITAADIYVDAGSLGYCQMCDFWGTKVMELAAEFGVEYFMRLDSDARWDCSNPCVYDNPFEVMKRGNFKYGYFQVLQENQNFCSRWGDFVRAYAKRHQLDLAATIAQRIPANWDNWVSTLAKWPTFYNNFEIVKVSFLLERPVQEFTRAVSETNNIYKLRWGDALIRFMQVALFQTQEDVVCFEGLMQCIHYWHDPFADGQPQCKWMDPGDSAFENAGANTQLQDDIFAHMQEHGFNGMAWGGPR